MAAILTLFATGPGWAAQPTPVPDQKPDLSSMLFKLGTWTCHSKVRGKDRPDTETYRLALDGRWIAGHDVAPPFDRFRTKAVVSDDRFTFNPLTKQWVYMYSDNFGGYITSTSPGWIGSTSVWTATASNDGVLGKSVETKVSDSETRFDLTYPDKNGKQMHSTGICKKSS